MVLEYVVVPLAAMSASALTFLSGFGLGTLLMPVLAISFPVPIAIGRTAIIRFLDNFFEIAFLCRSVDVEVALAFGLPAVAGVYGGALLLGLLSGIHPRMVHLVRRPCLRCRWLM